MLSDCRVYTSAWIQGAIAGSILHFFFVEMSISERMDQHLGLESRGVRGWKLNGLRNEIDWTLMNIDEARMDRCLDRPEFLG